MRKLFILAAVSILTATMAGCGCCPRLCQGARGAALPAGVCGAVPAGMCHALPAGVCRTLCDVSRTMRGMRLVRGSSRRQSYPGRLRSDAVVVRFADCLVSRWAVAARVPLRHAAAARRCGTRGREREAFLPEDFADPLLPAWSVHRGPLLPS